MNHENIISKFVIKGDVISVEPIGNGHINKTYLVTTSMRQYILQRINNNVFPNIKGLMNNLVRVTEHLLDKGVFTIKFIPTLDGVLFYEGNDGYYRMYKYIGDVVCYEGIQGLDIIRKAGEAFGKLHCDLSDLDPSVLVDIIPNFHNTVMRYKTFLQSVKKDPVGRVDSVRDEINFINEKNGDFSKIVKAIEDKEIPVSSTHNDPKINNVLFVKETNDVKCVIDLDTMMPGSVLFDFGDALRSLFTGENEDNKDLSKIFVDLDIYRAYLEGYWSSMKNTLNEKEIELLPYAVLTLTMELCIRFLTDYIDGDIYFATSRPEHNLDRARTQIKLAKDLYTNLDSLIKITKEITSQK